MKKLLILLLLLPIFSFGQVNTFPWTNDFESFITLQEDPNDNGNWALKQGSTSSANTGPSGDHTTGNGIYYYVESSYPGYPNQVFKTYTPTFDISATPGKVLSFWYHMYGNAMGDLEIAVISGGAYTPIDTISGNQGDQWYFAYYPITAVDSFKIAFKATTGSSFTSDICIDDLMVSDPFTFVYGCMDTISSNYDSTATINVGCLYYYGCMDTTSTNYNPWANVDDGSCVQAVACSPGKSLVDIAITLDNWPSETSWLIYSTVDTFASVPYGTYDYTQTGQTIHTKVCIPINTQIMFTINDTYGDGIGGGSVVGGCLVTNLDCEDTVFYLNPPNFGYSASSGVYTSASCNNDTTIYGCTNISYLEYDSLATDEDSSCVTLATYGCVDSTAFNYDPLADRMLLTSPCTYDLILYDNGGDSWGDCWLGVKQGDSLWQFKIASNGIYSDTFALELNSYDEVYLYYFEIATPQQNSQQLDIQTIQNSFKLENYYGTILHEGNNPWPGPNENKLRNYKGALDIYSALPYCGDECIPVVTGCMDVIAYNYNNLANTNDTCYYSPGCTNVGYLEYYTQGFVADIDDGSCITTAVFGCVDSTAFNYDSTANVDNGGCVPVVLGCMQALAFNYNQYANVPDTCEAVVIGCMNPLALNYDSLANTDNSSCVFPVYGCTDATMINYCSTCNVDDGTCLPFLYGCVDNTMYNYDPLANTDNGSCIPFVYGCVDSTQFNYNLLANTDNGSCVSYMFGCTDSTALNYSVIANTDDGSCIPYLYGCTDSIALNYNSLANTDDGSCVVPILGCTDINYFNYDSLANIDDGGCIAFVYGCMDASKFNYNALANTDDGSCIEFEYGCMDVTMWNYSSLANTDNGSCLPYIYGCMDSTMYNYSALANTDNATCIAFVYGCTDSLALNYNPLANTNDLSCIAILLGCTDSTALNYNFLANVDNGSCIAVVSGCTDSTMINYCLYCNVDDGSCIPYVYGCTDPTKFNYDSLANADDGGCIDIIYGCLDVSAFNYDPFANTENNSCVPVVFGCIDSLAFNYDPLANTSNSTCIPYIYGCTNPAALNYDPLANTDDLSCISVVYGCMDSLAFNYNPLANTDNSNCIPVILGCIDPIALNYCDSCNTDDFSCILPIYGCTDSIMFNYNPLANVDNNSCVPFIYGCTDPSMLNYDAMANTEDFTCIPFVYGCMDTTALNYDSLANTDNESCITIVEGCMELSAYNYDVTANVSDSLSCLFDAGCVTGPGNPYWLNDPCYAWVISVDDYCCDNEWDNICQLTYDYCEGSYVGNIPARRSLDDIVVYPNPASSIVNINKNVDINVFNYIGGMVISETNTSVLDVSILSPGIYTLQITYKNKTITKQLIKK